MKVMTIMQSEKDYRVVILGSGVPWREDLNRERSTSTLIRAYIIIQPYFTIMFHRPDNASRVSSLFISVHVA